MGTAVELDHAAFMDHFLKNGDEALGLHDLLAISINDGENRAGDAAGDAANVVAEVLPRIGFGGVVAGTFGNAAGARFGKQVGSTAVGRIDDQGGLAARAAGALT